MCSCPTRRAGWAREVQMSDIADVPPAVVGRLRVICGELPEAYEEPAWIGLRWRIRRRTFLHVYTTDGRRSAYIDG